VTGRPDPTARFSNRVADYVRWRPRYPAELLALLQRECGLRPGNVVADVGSGTGILTELFLKEGHLVYAVEPNAEMAEAAEVALFAYPGHRPVRGRAEATGLPDGAVDLVIAGQAFHWFEPMAARTELRRILSGDGGPVVLVWNVRRLDTPFLQEYEAFLHEWGTDYAEVSARHASESAVEAFFAPDAMRRHTLPNQQVFDLEGVRGRLLSSSYTPPPGHPRHAPMLDALATLHARHARDDGRVVFLYDTEVFWGRLT
jgi:SAM-dependent methyltransferase